jgi:hypothetical protein
VTVERLGGDVDERVDELGGAGQDLAGPGITRTRRQQVGDDQRLRLLVEADRVAIAAGVVRLNV